MSIGVEKIDTHKGVMIKVLLDSSATGMFMDRQTVARHGFKLQKLKRPIAIRNVDGTNNSKGAIMHQVECNVFYVRTEIEEGHDEIVEEILRRLEENDLYIKPEKCMWKARKIGFLEVVIGPNRIEIEAEKVDGVLSWP